MMPDRDFWRDRKVLITGHTGFKGAWLSAWMADLGAHVCGFAHAPEGEHNLWQDLKIEDRVKSVIGDLNDQVALHALFTSFQPDIVFHLAAQSLVRRSYRAPVETFTSNVVGTVSLLDVVRQHDCVKVVVVATSDKCYENDELDRPFSEEDRFGGRDPYSASKGCTEIATASMRMSYFKPFVSDGHSAGVASVRAGNVIGGGDWSEDRLVPDIVRGVLGPAGEAIIRSPHSIRPWQHVLEPLSGYIRLAETLHGDGAGFAEGWNFGPGTASEQPVAKVAAGLVDAIGQGKLTIQQDPNAPHEAKFLRLDASKAQARLGWRPVLNFADTLAMTADWYARWSRGEAARDITIEQIHHYTTQGAQTDA